MTYNGNGHNPLLLQNVHGGRVVVEKVPANPHPPLANSSAVPQAKVTSHINVIKLADKSLLFETVVGVGEGRRCFGSSWISTIGKW